MITNDKQYNSTRRTAEELRDSLNNLSASILDVHPKFIEAQKSALQSQISEMERDILDYDNLRSGNIKIFEAEELDEVPFLLIRARIARSMTQKDLAEYIGVKEQQIQKYEAERYKTASFERMIEIARALDVKIKEIAEIKGDHNLQDFSSKPHGSFPLAEMLKRGWFEGFNGNLTEARKNAGELIPAFFRRAHSNFTVAALHRKSVRANGQVHEPAIAAWEAWILIQASKKRLATKFAAASISHEWLKHLRSLTCYEDGPKRAVEHLEYIGILLIVEPHLPGTLLDGAALKTQDDRPVIAMTCRYDRLDNFWFTLFHEIGHLIMHISSDGYSSIFDNMDAPAQSEIESEADNFARETLLPMDLWHTAPSRFSRTEKAVTMDAHRLGIGAAIIAGRIRREANNYTLLRSLVGTGTVRKQFYASANEE